MSERGASSGVSVRHPSSRKAVADFSHGAEKVDRTEKKQLKAERKKHPMRYKVRINDSSRSDPIRLRNRDRTFTRTTATELGFKKREEDKTKRERSTQWNSDAFKERPGNGDIVPKRIPCDFPRSTGLKHSVIESIDGMSGFEELEEFASLLLLTSARESVANALELWVDTYVERREKAPSSRCVAPVILSTLPHRRCDGLDGRTVDDA